MKISVVCVLLISQQVSGVIYRLNASEYARLPDLFALDNYYRCLLAPGDTYCYVDAKLVAHETNQLFTTIQEYSAYNTTHFDHTVVHRGVCVTQTCRDHLENSTDLVTAIEACINASLYESHGLQEYSAYNTTHFDHTVVHRGVCVTQTCRDHLENSTDLVTAIEACINASLYESHGLQTRVVEDKVYCTEFNEPAGYDMLDYAVAILLVALLAFNVAGTLFDHVSSGDRSLASARMLRCFSFRRNWRRLFTTSEGPEPRLNRLKCFTGLKTITTFCVILAHSPLNAAISTSDPDYLENAYHNVMVTFLFNGTLIVQNFFIISGFLLAYSLLVLEEERNIGWEMLPKGILIRWLRLAPVHAVVLAFVCTWQRHLGDGPLWKHLVVEESLQCRRDWYYNLLYVNNYVDNSDCMIHTWYLGADMQLSILGLLVYLCSPRVRKMAVAAMFVVGVVTPAVHVIVQKLNPILIISPEVARNIFVSDPTFNNLYKRGHTNLVNYATGLAMAMVVHNLQQQKFDVTKFKKYLPLYYSLPLFEGLLCLSGCVLYIDGIQVPLAVQAVYASIIKVFYGLPLAVLIGGAIFKFENVYRGALEWRGWGPLGRLSYSAFLVHFIVIRTVTGAYAALAYNSCNQLVMIFLGVLCLSYLIAVPLWLLVEAPCGALIKVCFQPSKREINVELTRLNLKETVDIKI